MKIRAILVAVAVCLSLPALADFRTVARAYEVHLSEFSVPVTHNGIITFSECATCPSHSGRLTGDTQFIVNGKAVELKEFRKRVLQVRDRAHESVTVLHHLESDTITSVSITI